LISAGQTIAFYTRFIANATAIDALYQEIYGNHSKATTGFEALVKLVVDSYKSRSKELRANDSAKDLKEHWFLDNKLAGMSLYVDRFCGNIKNLQDKLSYFKKLGVNLLHLMPVFKSPEGESDGGYAVSDFRKVDERFGTIEDLRSLQKSMLNKGIYLMVDIVLNHTSRQHEWALKAKAGDPWYQDFFYMYNDHAIPSKFEETMPEIFPETAPGSFTWIEECQKWVMTVFHDYQWDLNYTNPDVFIAMLDNIFFYANLGVDVLRIDAPAFIWKQTGTNCQNLPQAHTLLKLIRQCVGTATPGWPYWVKRLLLPNSLWNISVQVYTRHRNAILPIMPPIWPCNGMRLRVVIPK
jgi:amylosucrase